MSQMIFISAPLDNIVFMIFEILLGSAKITEKSLWKNEQNEKFVEKLSFRILLFQVCSILRPCICFCFFFILVESISFAFVLLHVLFSSRCLPLHAIISNSLVCHCTRLFALNICFVLVFFSSFLLC